MLCYGYMYMLCYGYMYMLCYIHTAIKYINSFQTKERVSNAMKLSSFKYFGLQVKLVKIMFSCAQVLILYTFCERFCEYV